MTQNMCQKIDALMAMHMCMLICSEEVQGVSGMASISGSYRTIYDCGDEYTAEITMHHHWAGLLRFKGQSQHNPLLEFGWRIFKGSGCSYLLNFYCLDKKHETHSSAF